MPKILVMSCRALGDPVSSFHSDLNSYDITPGLLCSSHTGLAVFGAHPALSCPRTFALALPFTWRAPLLLSDPYSNIPLVPNPALFSPNTCHHLTQTWLTCFTCYWLIVCLPLEYKLPKSWLCFGHCCFFTPFVQRLDLNKNLSF